MARPFTTRTILLALAALVTVLWFGALEVRGLYKPDEGRYADIPRAMLDSGDWVTPRLNGLKYFEKPPFQYWMTAAAFRVFGPDEWTARLWTALSGFLGVLATLLAARRLVGEESGRRAAFVLAGMWGYFAGAQYLTLDMGLTFFLTLALLAFLLAHGSGASPRQSRNWMLAAWAAMGLAVLSKGLIGFVLPALVLAVFMAVQREWRLLRGLHIAPGLMVFLLVAAPWFLLVQIRNHEFFDFFFIGEHFARFALPGHHRPGPWWYFVPVLAVIAMPWTPVLPAVLQRAWRSTGAGTLHVDRFLVCWAAATFVFFSISSSKLPAYILPILPALALLIGRHWPELPPAVRRAPAITLIVAGATAAVAVPIVGHLERFAAARELLPSYQPWLLGCAAVLIATGTLAMRFQRRPPWVPLATLMVGSIVSLHLGMLGMHVFDDLHSSENLIERISGDQKRFPSDVPFYSVDTFDHSVPFYLGRPVTLVTYKGELAPGIAAEPRKYIPSVEEFERQWSAGAEAYAVMSTARYASSLEHGLPMRLVGRDVRSVIVARR